MGVDVTDAVTVEFGLLQGALHGQCGAAAVVGRQGDVEGVGAGAVADQERVDVGAAVAGMLFVFENEDAGALGDDEPVAAGVEGPRGGLGAVVETGAHGPPLGEAGQADTADGGLAAAGDHGHGVAALDGGGGLADGVGATGAGRDVGHAGPVDPQVDGHLAGGQVDDHHRHQEGRDPPRAALGEDVVLGGEGGDAADAAADETADAGA